MLALFPTCEHCGCGLPPASTEARICSYECTFCATCVETVLHNVCPNCGGGFQPRPVRPRRIWVDAHSTTKHPPSTERKRKPIDERTQARLVALVGATLPCDR